MEYVTLGRTGRKVSRIGFGGAPAGFKNYVTDYDPEAEADRQRVIDAIRKAYELGITYYDTAAAYGAGLSESLFAEGLKGIALEDYLLATKVMPIAPDSSKGEMKFASGKQVREFLEGSLKRLGRDYVDLIQLHGVCYTPEAVEATLKPGGILDELERARDEGLVKFIGFTTEAQNTAVEQFIETDRFDTMQVLYNLMFQHPYDPNWKIGSIYHAKKHNMGVQTMRTMTAGIFQKYMKAMRPDDDYDYNAACLQFVLSNPDVDVALLGMRSIKNVIRNVNTVNDTAHRVDIYKIHDSYTHL